MLVYPPSLKIESLMIDNFELQSDLNRANQTSLGGNPKTVMNPLLLVPGWTGFFIKVRDNIVVIQSTIVYLDTLDSPATNLKTAYEVLCLGCEIKERQ